MGGIPVLNDSQMNALRRVVGTNQKFDLTGTKKSQGRRLPTYEEENDAQAADVKIGAVVTSPAGGFGAGMAQDIIANTDGTYSINTSGAVMGYINLYL